MTRQPAAVVQPIPVPHRRFSHLHVDLVGPLPTSPEGFKYIFTVIDRSTRWLEAAPVKNREATTAADALVESWISRFGVPADKTSDRGTQFSSQVWAKLCSRLGIRHHMMTAYHPASNGLVERAHHQLKDSLRERLASTSPLGVVRVESGSQRGQWSILCGAGARVSAYPHRRVPSWRGATSRGIFAVHERFPSFASTYETSD
jgi:transposase InsO family protein